MATSATSPKCEGDFRCPDDAAGKRIRCRYCRHVFLIGPARRLRREPDGDAGFPTWLLVAIPAGVLLLVAGTGIAVGIAAFRSAVPPPQAQGPAPGPIPVPGLGPAPGPAPAPPPAPVPTPEPGPQLRPPEPIAWTVQPDPLPTGGDGPFDTKTSITVGDLGAQLPSTPSPFGVLSPVPKNREEAVYQVYDLRTMKPAGKPIPRRLLHQHVTASPNGRHVLTVNPQGGIDVFSAAEGERIGGVPKLPAGNLVLIDFAPDGRPFTVHDVNGLNTARTWDPATGQAVAEFRLAEAADWRWVTFTPGHRYFILQETRPDSTYHLHFHELATGKVAGHIELQAAGAAWGQSGGIAVSRDGEELTVLWRLNHPDCWAKMMPFDLKAGKKLPELKLPKLLTFVEGLWWAGGVRSLQYMPDRRRWLLFNHLVIDRDTGLVAGKVGAAPGGANHITTRRFLDDRHFATVAQSGPGGGWFVRVEALPEQAAMALDDKSPAKVYLSDMEPVQEQVGWGKFGKKGWLGYGLRPGEQDRRITVGGKSDPNGLSMHPPGYQASFATYQLDGKAKSFHARAALNDLATNERNGLEAPLIFKVVGDGKVLWESAPHQEHGKTQECVADVAGVKVLELQVFCPRGPSMARAVWLDAHVAR